jgi:general nucleoside transport system ATP-binding protein
MIHQHFMLVPTQTVTENILLGLDEPRFILNLDEYNRASWLLQAQYGLRVDPEAKIWQLSVGEQQRVEILKVLYRGAEILIMDEPTAVLAPQEIAALIATMRAMTAEGKSIVFISHKLQEVAEVADRVTVLRKGKGDGRRVSMEGVTRAELARLMVGRDVVFPRREKPQKPRAMSSSPLRTCALRERQRAAGAAWCVAGRPPAVKYLALLVLRAMGKASWRRRLPGCVFAGARS